MSRYHSASMMLASGTGKWWHSPTGKAYAVREPSTHRRWMSDNAEALKDEYGIELNALEPSTRQLTDAGWARVLASGGGVNAEVRESRIAGLEGFLIREFPQLWREGSGAVLILNNVDMPASAVQSHPSLREAYRAAKREQTKAASLALPPDRFPAEYPPAGDTVSGLRVTDDIPNMGSIPASMMEYEILEGVREVPMSHFPGRRSRLDSKVGVEGSSEMAREIEGNGWIDPLIVGIEADAVEKGPYILEGAHRFDALAELGIESFPALVVLDTYGSMPVMDPEG